MCYTSYTDSAMKRAWRLRVELVVLGVATTYLSLADDQAVSRVKHVARISLGLADDDLASAADLVGTYTQGEGPFTSGIHLASDGRYFHFEAEKGITSVDRTGKYTWDGSVIAVVDADAQKPAAEHRSFELYPIVANGAITKLMLGDELPYTPIREPFPFLRAIEETREFRVSFLRAFETARVDAVVSKVRLQVASASEFVVPPTLLVRDRVGWARCPRCSSQFNPDSPLSYDGKRHIACGAKLWLAIPREDSASNVALRLRTSSPDKVPGPTNE